MKKIINIYFTNGSMWSFVVLHWKLVEAKWLKIYTTKGLKYINIDNVIGIGVSEVNS